MTRLFDAEKEKQTHEAVRARRDEVRRRAEEADTALREAGLMDDKSNAITGAFARMEASRVETVQPIRYESYRKPGGRMTIEHAVAGADYIYQVFPLRPPTIASPDILLIMITAMDGIFPRSVHVTYAPPAEILPQKFYTVRVLKVVGQPGWQDAVGRALLVLSELELWP
ncbi:MAG: hypothetical protein EPN91_12960 [Salinibacterium sp.]|nr:MAG: hypothetical protein EPN91_12960 [Salinibacterium sp.]